MAGVGVNTSQAHRQFHTTNEQLNFKHGQDDAVCSTVSLGRFKQVWGNRQQTHSELMVIRWRDQDDNEDDDEDANGDEDEEEEEDGDEDVNGDDEEEVEEEDRDDDDNEHEEERDDG